MTNNVKTIQLDIDQNYYDAIKHLEKATGGHTGEVIRDAIGLYTWLEKQYRNGYSVVTYKNGRAERELNVNFKKVN